MVRSPVEEMTRRDGEVLWGAVGERLGADLAGRTTALLVGSAAAGFADGYSRPDLLLLLASEEDAAEAAERLGLNPGEWGRLRLGGASGGASGGATGGVSSGAAPAAAGKGGAVAPGRAYDLAAGKACVVAAGSLERAVLAREDDALFLLHSGRVLHDPDGTATHLVELAGRVPPETWAEKAAAAYRAFRQRKASLAWAMRRGQPYICLDNITRLVSLSLRLCYYLAGKPPANAKWLFQGAMRTPTGRRIRPVLWELFGALGDVAVLGGSYNLRHNAVYTVLTRLQRTLEDELR